MIPFVENLLTIKAVLKSFELVSGLKVGFFQELSDLSECPFLDLLELYLPCKVDSLLF